MDNKEKRALIERIWKTIHQHPENVELVASEVEWAFMEALLDYSPARKRGRPSKWAGL